VNIGDLPQLQQADFGLLPVFFGFRRLCFAANGGCDWLQLAAISRAKTAKFGASLQPASSFTLHPFSLIAPCHKKARSL
jgi:hypothetical protein